MPVKMSPELVNALDGHEWETELFESPCASPVVCCGAVLCPCCVAYKQREEILHITGEPYYFLNGACSCLPCCAGPLGEGYMPCILGCEVCCCIGSAVAINRYMIQTRFARENSAWDNFMISFAVCLDMFACVCECIAFLASVTGNGDSNMEDAASCLTLISDMVNCTVMSCMLAQQEVELRAIKQGPAYSAPPRSVYECLPPDQQKMVNERGCWDGRE
mmetsp:Transcript_121551/g.378325  ORF Transcript_121551/g.378325 Transcript_121551/m.378325 type:complete len:219 (-) Transcript_121551:82-738(-)|eukprot:CAMPEP_0204601196 /NCGR_PEP_ID=MMETSP0661-20131031/55883_1 /ASSEMBLY_ACC=CAM_ASM_000606 /TAXON_ID=109239 /ORGANISM="Alexandrium margalefi, Strain AMGDE01CS-322" /LENGTH=218 /DNA_ID=CAMNT_0051612043 /DNA_START=97 /DNA_END=753 /DNA_ORIENTATION=-